MVFNFLRTMTMDMRRRQQEIDEELGGTTPCNNNGNFMPILSEYGEDNNDVFDLSSPPMRIKSIHSDDDPDLTRHDSSFSAHSSDTTPKDEHLDHVSELTPLMTTTGDRAARALSPPIIRPRRSLSEESIATVAALPGMVLRAHSIHVGAAGRHSEVTCSICPSSTKAALKAVQQEQRASRRKHEQNTRTDDTSTTTLKSQSSFAIKESYWIDIETPPRSTEELSEFLYQLRLPSFFVSILSEPTTWASEVVALQFISLAIFQILPADPNSDEIAHVALLSMPRLLVTFSTFPKNEDSDSRLYHLVYQYMKQRERVPEPTSSGLLIAWLQFHVRRTAVALRKLRVRAVEMDNELDRDFQHFDFEDLVEAKDCLLSVLSVAEEQHGTIDALSAAEKGTEGFDFSNCSAALSMLCAHASSNERLSSRVDKHLNELRERIMAHREDNINQKMALLTILSAVFMPLTLLSGIWGMNFESMPELEMEGAYQKALLGMLLLALCMVYSFKRAGFTAHP